MSQKDYDMNPRWYVVHTYSGYENKVKTDLEKTIKNVRKPPGQDFDNEL